MDENKKSTTDKISKELENFRNEICKKSPEEIYDNSGSIMFFECVANYLGKIAKLNDAITNKAILAADKTIKSAVISLIDNLKNKYGQSGDLSNEEFESLVQSYYGIDAKYLNKVIEEKKLQDKINDSNLKIKKRKGQTSIFDFNKPQETKANEDMEDLNTFDNSGLLQVQLKLSSLNNLGGDNND